MIHDAISDLRKDLALLDSTIEQVEALLEDPPRKLRPRKLDVNRPVIPKEKNALNGHA